ncbi:MAG: 4a-hydroxytetrahydrobiopterin dehydratase [Proteobacteria bacterium]|nr:4a-hydroxytetrahydrobiopterin dehydratase [Pseudomonadota bacterium]
MGPVTLAGLAAEHCVSGAPRLPDTDIAGLLAALPGWTRDGDALAKTYAFADYYRTIEFVNAVAAIAHRADHHPDLAVGYDRCRVAYATHSAGGITRNDVICAARVEMLVA